jgi:K+-sensing histidine kinase KdpD
VEQASRIEIVKLINDVQRRLGNLHASITNLLSSTRMSINERTVTSEDVTRRFDEEVHQMQEELKAAVKQLTTNVQEPV